MPSFFFTKHIEEDRWGYVEVIASDSDSAANTMYKKYGSNWCFQYDSLDKVHTRDRNYIETLYESTATN